ncbi:hypothetical protein [Vulcanisaeta sp. JCM 14467]|uniref:hypothetical protein n=1 Tax=Vulcanisaeta sp. JCM 14467 TaxID=1295370 RepID=UPI002092CFA1|nr:hypothetical protein [Vulcanisaeta sp. JCM 14467]
MIVWCCVLGFVGCGVRVVSFLMLCIVICFVAGEGYVVGVGIRDVFDEVLRARVAYVVSPWIQEPMPVSSSKWSWRVGLWS